MSIEKYVKSIDLGEGRMMLRNPVSGRWEIHQAGRDKSQVSDAQQHMLDAAVHAGIVYGRSGK